MRRLRVDRGLSRERLAADAAIDRAYLGGLERQTENPTIDLIDRIAETLGVPLTELFVSPSEGDSPLRRCAWGGERRDACWTCRLAEEAERSSSDHAHTLSALDN